MSTGNHQLGKLDHGAKMSPLLCPLIAEVGDAESESHQKKYANVFHRVRKRCGRPDARGNHRKNNDSREPEPRQRATVI